MIIEGDPARNYYVQFALDEGRLYCEAASNEYLESADALDDDQMLALENLGWCSPENEGQNWLRTFRPVTDGDYREIVDLARRAFADVYRLSPDSGMTTTCSWEETEPGGGNAMENALAEARDRAAKKLPCPACESSRAPLIRKPRPTSPRWWEDPSCCMGCAECGAFIELLPSVHPYIWMPEVAEDLIESPPEQP